MELQEYRDRNKVTMTEVIIILGIFLITGTIALGIKLEELGMIL